MAKKKALQSENIGLCVWEKYIRSHNTSVVIYEYDKRNFMVMEEPFRAKRKKIGTRLIDRKVDAIKIAESEVTKIEKRKPPTHIEEYDRFAVKSYWDEKDRIAIR